MNQNSKKVLITGVLGFIGGHTAKAFKKAGYTVIGIDRTFTIPQSALFVDELFVDDFVDMAPYVADQQQISTIIHIAGTSLVGPSITDPGVYYDNNVAKTNKMLDELSKRDWQGNIIFSSSAAVYGNNCPVPISEIAVGIPVSPYGNSKKICEQIISDHSRAHGFRSIALRYFNACGCDPDQEIGNAWNDSHIIPKFIQTVIENKEIVINGINFATEDGTCVRDYLHVSDIADAHLRAAELCDSLSPGEFRAYNLGSGKGYSNLEILNGIQQAMKKNVHFTFGPQRAGDPDILIADPLLFQSDTQWSPAYDLNDMIETTVNWMTKTS